MRCSTENIKMTACRRDGRRQRHVVCQHQSSSFFIRLKFDNRKSAALGHTPSAPGNCSTFSHLAQPTCQNSSVGTVACGQPQFLHCWYSVSLLHLGVWHAHDRLVCSIQSAVCSLHLLSLLLLHRIPTGVDVLHMHIASPLLVYESPRYHSWIDTYLDRSYDTTFLERIMT